MTILRIGIVAVLLLAGGGPVQAGGSFETYHRAPYCRYVEDAQLLVSYGLSQRHTLMSEVEQRYYEASEVATAPATIYTAGGVSTGINPVFVWATEAKTSCAKAIGYLKLGHWLKGELNVEMLQKCECFHQRMTYYLGRR